jgi:hypothetical protein
VLTADDAAAWLHETGLTLFLPRTAHIAAPAPTFVEATMGEPNPMPKPAAIANAHSLLHRLLAAHDVVALNLLGIPGDQPDFLATEETLPFLFALRGDREWERGPRGKSTPLVLEVWKLLDREGALSAEEIKDQLGRQLTEAAALRALTDLWTNLRVEPVYAEAEGTRWQRLEVNHAKTMKAGSAMAQGMALSALVSLYLQSAVAASVEEIEAFLSPVTSRSKVREAVRGLIATRQVHTRNLGAHELMFVEGSLPEFAEPGDSHVEDVKSALPDLLPEVEEPTDVVVEGETGSFRIEALSEVENEKERTIGEGRKRFVAARQSKTTDRGSFAARPERPRKSFPPRRDAGEAKPFHAREPWKEDQRPARPARPAADRGAQSFGERKPFRAKPAGADRPPFERSGADRKPFGEKKPFERKAYGAGSADRPNRPGTDRPDRKPFPRREDGPAGDRGFERRAPRAEGSADRKPFGERKPFGDRKPFGSRPETGERKPFAGKSFGDRKPFASRPDAADRKPFGEKKPFNSRPPSGDRKPFGATGPRDSAGTTFGGTRPPRRGFTPRDEETPRPYQPRTGEGAPRSGDRKPFTPRDGERPARRPYRPDRGPDRGNDREGGTARPYNKSSSSSFSGSSSPRPSSPRSYQRRESPSAGGYKPRNTGTSDGPARPFRPRTEGGERPPFRRSDGTGDRPYMPRSFKPREEGARPFTKSPGRPSESRPYRKPEGDADDRAPRRSSASPAPKRFGAGERPSRPGAPVARPGGKRPRTSTFTSTGKPRTGVKATGRPGPRAARPGAAGTGRPAGPRKTTGKPGGKPRTKGPKR